MNAEEFYHYSRGIENLHLELNASGKILVSELADPETSIFSSIITGIIGLWNRSSNLGVVFGSCTGFTLSNGAVRVPDTAWIKKERWFLLAEEQREKFAAYYKWKVHINQKTESPKALFISLIGGKLNDLSLGLISFTD